MASLAACHKLWYLHLAAEAGITVIAYCDQAEGVMQEQTDGSGRFTYVVLRPTVTVSTGAEIDRANALHGAAHDKCFVANSVNFTVACEPKAIVA